MERLPLLDGPGRLRNFFINERNRLRAENPDLERCLRNLVESLPEETFTSDPRLAAQHGAGFGYFEITSHSDVGSNASRDFMPDPIRHAFNAFIAMQPRKPQPRFEGQPQPRFEDELYTALRVRLHKQPIPPHIDEGIVEEAEAFIAGYDLVKRH